MALRHCAKRKAPHAVCIQPQTAQHLRVKRRRPRSPIPTFPALGEEQNLAHQSGALIFQIRRGSTFSVNMRNDEWLSGAQSK